MNYQWDGSFDGRRTHTDIRISDTRMKVDAIVGKGKVNNGGKKKEGKVYNILFSIFTHIHSLFLSLSVVQVAPTVD